MNRGFPWETPGSLETDPRLWFIFEQLLTRNWRPYDQTVRFSRGLRRSMRRFGPEWRLHPVSSVCKACPIGTDTECRGSDGAQVR